MINKLLRLHDVAELLSCSTRKVYRMVADGVLPALQINSAWRVDPSDLQNYISRQKQRHAEDYGYCE
jgi:excisionase family DNA binding protein